MPKRTDIKSILIIGAGPIVIGQACEFDYSGVQACKALKAEGYRVILVNSNPATIMTDPEVADATYIEPITPEMVEKIIAKERPDALLPTMGGQTALNTALALERMGVLEKYGVEMIGARAEVIDKAEDRQKFRDAMDKLGLESPRSKAAHSMEEALDGLEFVGLPAVIRPSFTLAGTGGGIAYNREEFEEIVLRGLDLSPTTEVLIEESVLGWKEYEMEVVRAIADKVAVMENGKVVEYGSVYEVFSKPRTHVAQRFVSTSLRNTPDEVEARELLAEPGRLFTVDLSENSGFFGAVESARAAGVSVQPVHGGVTTLQNHSFGKMTVRLNGDDAAISQFLATLQRTTDIQEIVR